MAINTIIITQVMINNIVDIHSHIIFGVDDGAETIEDSIKTLELLEKLNIKKVICTPHLCHGNIEHIKKIKENYLKDAIVEYSKRLSKYCNLNIIELPDEKLPNNLNETLEESIKQKECKNVIAHLKKDSYIISLDLKGKELSSEEFSKKLEDISLNLNSSITFIIGGTLGLTKEIIDISKESICFSKMTFPHQLIRVFLLEQIFRAFKISKGENYHR